MDGIHDLGGMEGFGPVVHEADEPVFHESWQEFAFCLLMTSSIVLSGTNADKYRHSVERLAPDHYLRAHYYERMFTGVTTLFVEGGLLDIDDLTIRAGGRFPLAHPVADGPLADIEPQLAARFTEGDRVRIREMSPRGHTRAPRFCRGKEGVVLRVAPRFGFPDSSAHDGEHRDEHTYHVEFTATELWGDDESVRDSVVVDLWDSYLEEPRS